MKLGTRELPMPKKLYDINDTTNKAGNITHYMDLSVETVGRKREMRLLVSNIGREDAILGYPWLSAFEPWFSWAHGTINTQHLPIILQSLNPTEERDVVAGMQIEEKQRIVNKLE